MCKEFGGLGIPNLRDLNICLLGSWLKGYQVDDNKFWKKLLDHKYRIKEPNIFQPNTQGASIFFKGVIWTANAAKVGYVWKIGNGQKVKFWEDN